MTGQLDHDIRGNTGYGTGGDALDPESVPLHPDAQRQFVDQEVKMAKDAAARTYWTRMPLIALALFATVAVIGFATSLASREPTKADATFPTRVDFSFSAENEYTQKYGPIAQQYEWVSMPVMDVHKTATLSVVESGDSEEESDEQHRALKSEESGSSDSKSATTYHWRVVLGDDDQITEFEGKSIDVTFTSVGEHFVKVAKFVNGDVVREYEGSILAKYVRRELRMLTDEDRETFLDTMQTMYTVDAKTGQELYGSSFQPASFLTTYHNNMAGSMDCDHFHDGLGFLVWHSALTNRFEEMMQMIEPSVTMPYWDFTIEGQSVTDHADEESDTTTDSYIDAFETYFENSEVFADDWFGPLNPEEGYFTSGRWKELEVDKAEDVDNIEVTVQNAYGYVRAPWNMNPSKYVSRYNGVNGASTSDVVTCAEHYDLMYVDDYESVGFDMQYTPHGSVHTVVGGVDNNDLVSYFGENHFKVGSVQYLAESSFIFQKNLWRDGFYSCPTTCSTDDDTTSCKCSCPSMDTSPETMAAAVANRLDKDMGNYLINNNGVDKTHEFMTALCGEALDTTPYIGEMLESASPADPLFWPIHPTLERLFQRWIMTGDREMSWPDDMSISVSGFQVGACEGHNSDDSMTTVKGLFEEGVSYTTGEYLDALSPSSDSMNYVYHNFAWEHCTSAGMPTDFAISDDYTPTSDYGPSKGEETPTEEDQEQMDGRRAR